MPAVPDAVAVGEAVLLALANENPAPDVLDNTMLATLELPAATVPMEATDVVFHMLGTDVTMVGIEVTTVGMLVRPADERRGVVQASDVALAAGVEAAAPVPVGPWICPSLICETGFMLADDTHKAVVLNRATRRLVVYMLKMI